MKWQGIKEYCGISVMILPILNRTLLGEIVGPVLTQMG